MRPQLSPQAKLKRAQREPTQCANPACAAPLEGLHYFCRSCYFKAPPKLRAHLYSMHHRGQDCGSKVAQIVRSLQPDAVTPNAHGG